MAVRMKEVSQVGNLYFRSELQQWVSHTDHAKKLAFHGYRINIALIFCRSALFPNMLGHAFAREKLGAFFAMLPAMTKTERPRRRVHLLTLIVVMGLVFVWDAPVSAKPKPVTQQPGPLDVVVSNQKLFVERKEYFIRAMAYQPEPLGIKNMDDAGFAGGGLCSVRRTSWGEWKSACYDSDYFDGSDGGLDRVPSGPANWFRALWERDIPYLKELGVNTLRLYNVNPTTAKASEELLDSRWNGITEPRGKEHRKFLDMVHAAGLKVMFPLMGDSSMLNDTVELRDQKIRNLIDEVGDHPAILMWVVGNEFDFKSSALLQLRALLNDEFQKVRDYTKSKWNRVLPVTTCVIDIPDTYDILADTLDVDLFCANAGYRGESLTDLFSGNAGFSGWKALSASTGLPLLIGELGWTSINNSINHNKPDWFNRIWSDVVKHTDDGCIGGCFFEYSDELYKKNAPPDQIQLGVVELLERFDNDTGKSTLEVDVFIADDVVRKPILFAAVANGTIDGEPMNFNMDVFKYLKRPPETLVVAPSPPPTSLPPSSTPFLRASLIITVIALTAVLTLV